MAKQDQKVQGGGQRCLGFLEKPRQLAKLLQEAWPKVQASRSLEGAKGAKWPHLCTGECDGAFQLAQLACTISQGFKGCTPAGQNSHRHKKVPVGNIKCRPAKVFEKTVPMAKRECRCGVGAAGGLQGWLTSLPLPSNAKTHKSWCKTKHRTSRLRGPEARRAAGTSGNSKRTQTWIITERSNGDVQVLRMVKNGVSTPVLQARKT